MGYHEKSYEGKVEDPRLQVGMGNEMKGRRRRMEGKERLEKVGGGRGGKLGDGMGDRGFKRTIAFAP